MPLRSASDSVRYGELPQVTLVHAFRCVPSVAPLRARYVNGMRWSLNPCVGCVGRGVGGAVPDEAIGFTTACCRGLELDTL